jgi:hypothetical protein
MTTADNGPFETQRQSADSVRHIYDAMRASTRRGVMAEEGHKLLDEACTAAGLEVGAYDHRVMQWLAGFEPEMCAVVAGLITRASQARGVILDQADAGTVRQGLADASAWRTWRTGGDRAADAERAAAYDALLRRMAGEDEVTE